MATQLNAMEDSEREVEGPARPLRPIPAIPSKTEVNKLSTALVKHFLLSKSSALGVASACVSPATALALLENPMRYRVPGGELLFIRLNVYADRIIADASNPRTLHQLPFPAAVTPGSSEIARYGPVPLPTSPAEQGNLELEVDSISQLIWQLDQMMQAATRMNTPQPPINVQGLLDPPLAVAVDLIEPGQSAVGTLLVREGSSRVSHVHRILDLSARDLLLTNRSENGHRVFLDRLRTVAEGPRSQLTPIDEGKLRVAVLPVDVVIGFDPDPDVSMTLAECVAARVEQDHINHKLQWQDSAKEMHLGEVCLQSLRAAALISEEKYRWLAGRITTAEANSLGLQEHPDDRWATLLWYFTTRQKDISTAVRKPIFNALSKNSKRSVRNREDKIPLAISLAMRARIGSIVPAAVEREVKVLSASVLQYTWKQNWEEPGRATIEELVDLATEDSLAHRTSSAGIELSNRAAWYLMTHNSVAMPRNDRGPGGDRRLPSELLEGMLNSVRGVRQLGQIVKDGRQGRVPGLVANEAGTVETNAYGDPVHLKDNHLRGSLVPQGGLQPPPPRNNRETFLNQLAVLKGALNSARSKDEDLRELVDDSGALLYRRYGVGQDWADDAIELLGELERHIKDYAYLHNLAVAAGEVDE